MLRWNTPLPAARASSGSAARRAAVAASLSPLAIASSTLRRKVRTRLRRAVLILVRFSILRVAFLAEGVFAILEFLVAHGPCALNFRSENPPDERNRKRRHRCRP